VLKKHLVIIKVENIVLNVFCRNRDAFLQDSLNKKKKKQSLKEQHLFEIETLPPR